MANKLEIDFKKALNNIKDGYYRVIDGRIDFINESFTKMLGYTLDEVKGQIVSRYYVHQPDRDWITKIIAKGKEVHSFRVKVFNSKNDIVFIETDIHPLKDELGNVIGEAGTFKEVTDKINLEKRIFETEHRYKNIVEQANEVIFNTDISGKITFVNQKAIDFFGIPESEFVDRNYINFVPLSHQKDVLTFYSNQFKNKIENTYFEFPVKTSSGEIVWLGQNLQTQWDSNKDRIIGYSAVARNITLRKKSEFELLSTKELLEETSRIAKIGGWEYDLISSKLYWSDVTKKIHDQPTSYEPAFDSAINYFKEGESRIEFEKMVDQAINLGEEFDAELKLITARAREIWVRVKGIPVVSGDRCVKLMGTLENITEKRDLAEALKQNRMKLDLFFEQSLDGSFFMMLDEPIEWNNNIDKNKVVDYVFDNQRVTKVNDAMLNQYKAKRDDFIGLTPNDLFKHNNDEAKSNWRKLFDNGKLQVQLSERKFDGSSMWVEVDYVCLYDNKNNITGHFGVQRDVTLQKHSQIALEQSEERYKKLYQNVPLGIITADNHGSITSANTMCEIMFGYSLDRIKTLTIPDLIASIASNTKPFNLMKSFFLNPESRKMLSKTRSAIGLKMDGSTIPLEISMSYFRFGNVPQVILIITDVSERTKALETKKLLEDRETMLKEIHHRVKNNMQVVSSLLSLQSSQIKDKESLEKFKESEARIKSMALIHEKLYESDNFADIDLGEYIEGLCNQMVHTYSIETDVQIKTELDIVRLSIDKCIPSGLIINEFLTNSFKYGFKGLKSGEISINLTEKDEVVKLIIRDNGVGIAEDVQLGKTLGIRLIKSLAKQLRGEYKIENDNGTKCTLVFSKITNE